MNAVPVVHLYPADPLKPRSVDAHFAPEAEALREAGGATRVVNVDALERHNGDPVLPWIAFDEPTLLIYRGWMMSSDNYAELNEYAALKGGVLRTSPSQYQRAHELPGWYDAFHAYTPKTVELPVSALVDLPLYLRRLGADKVFVKDYTKSLKNNPAASIIENAADPHSSFAVVENFIRERGEYLVGNVLLREFEDFVGREVRTWWVKGELRLVTAHPDTPDTWVPLVEDDLPKGFVETLRESDLPFVSADFVERRDGVWRLVEIGDGQVSDRPATASPQAFLRVLQA